jgi:predicted O-methyltransferase YrrM
MSNNTLNLTPEVYDYLQKNSLREVVPLVELRKQTQSMNTGGMQISPEQGQFMQLLVKLIGAKKTLEIGVFTGYSTLSVALALPADGKIVACDINKEWTQIAARFWEMAGVKAKIDLRLAPAQETLAQLIEAGESDTFDFAFIDADKLNYLNYYEFALKLTRPGGLIMIDNVLWDGDVAKAEVNDAATKTLRELNQKIYHDERVMISMLPVGDGVTLALKK